MPSSEPTFECPGGLDLGQPGGQLYESNQAIAMIRVSPGSPEIAAGLFAFPRVSAVFRTVYGLRGQLIVWHCEIQAAESVIASIERQIHSLMASGTEYPMTFHGQTRQNVAIVGYAPKGYREQLADGGRLFVCDITFMDMTP